MTAFAFNQQILFDGNAAFGVVHTLDVVNSVAVITDRLVRFLVG